MKSRQEPGRAAWRQRVRGLWLVLRPYRIGFLLGILSLSLVSVLAYTGTRSEKLDFIRQLADKDSELSEASPTSSHYRDQEDKNASSESTGINSKKEVIRKNSSIGNKVNVNTASLEELISLPSIGPVIAQRILDYRKQYGPFGKIEDLDKVKGIGPKVLEKIKPWIFL